jgi:hypothetical protein
VASLDRDFSTAARRTSRRRLIIPGASRLRRPEAPELTTGVSERAAELGEHDRQQLRWRVVDGMVGKDAAEFAVLDRFGGEVVGDFGETGWERAT